MYSERYHGGNPHAPPRLFNNSSMSIMSVVAVEGAALEPPPPPPPGLMPFVRPLPDVRTEKSRSDPPPPPAGGGTTALDDDDDVDGGASPSEAKSKLEKSNSSGPVRAIAVGFADAGVDRVAVPEVVAVVAGVVAAGPTPNDGAEAPVPLKDPAPPLLLAPPVTVPTAGGATSNPSPSPSPGPVAWPPPPPPPPPSWARLGGSSRSDDA